MGDFIAQTRLQKFRKEVEDGCQAYCALPPSVELVENRFSYWQAQEQSFPKLSKLAFNLLAMPAMSAECERGFGSCKLLITPNPNHWNAESIEASECLRDWYRQEILK